MQIFRVKIALDFHRTEETNFGLIHKYTPTLNRKNEGITGIEKIEREPTGDLVVILFKLEDGNGTIDWSLGYDIKHNYDWLKDLRLNNKIILMKAKIVTHRNNLYIYSRNWYN